MTLKPRLVLLAVVVGLAALLATHSEAQTRAKSDFEKVVDRYYDNSFAANPIMATMAGVHDKDHLLPDMSKDAYAKRVVQISDDASEIESLFNTLDLKLKPEQMSDIELLLAAMRAELQDIEVLKSHTTNPVTYLGKPAEGIDLLMKRTFAPPAERLKSVIGRLKMSPAILTAMKANIVNPPKEFADLGLIVAKGSVGFFKTDLPLWAKTAAGYDAKLLAEFEAANTPVIAAFEDAAKWVETDLLPRAKGNYAIGADAFLKKLQYEEMLDIPLDKLLAIGEANLKKDQELFIATAKKIDPTKTPAQVLAMLTDDHPKPDDLVGFTRGTIERTRQFIIDKKIISVPTDVRPTVLETPPFMRTGGFASMDSPGPFETKATEAFYYVTPPEKEWDSLRKVEHMRQFNATGMDIITIHEAFPGHYMQFVFAKDFPTKARKMTGCGTNVEGWAHYCEQMLIEEGYGNNDPKMLLAQLNEALLRDCRYIVGIKLHTAGWTVEQGKQFFIKEGYIEPETAFQEARRGTYNPTYLYYTLGKLQIYKLREDYKKLKGADYSLQKFHDEFIKQGGIPIKLIRGIMLPGDTGPSL
ncbi:DUF885 domain-containing protein [soil metagenome]